MSAASEAVPPPPLESYRAALDGWHLSTGGVVVPASRQPAGLDFSGKFALFFVDTILWALCAVICAGVFWGAGVPLFIPNPKILIIPCFVSLFAGWLVGAYDRDTTFVSLRFASESLIAGFVATLVGPGLVGLFGNYGGAFQTSRLFLFVIPVMFVILSLVARRRLWRSFGGSLSSRRVIVIGTPEEASSVGSALQLTERLVDVTRIAPSDAVGGALKSTLAEDPSPGPGSRRRPYSDTVVIAPSAAGGVITPLNPFLVSLHSSSVPVYSWSAFWNQRIRMHDSQVDSAEWLFEKDFQMASSSVYWHLKRLMDVLIATTGLILCLPVLLVAALLVFLDSKGGIVFTQERVGFRGNPFTIFKFRTMSAGSDADGTTTAKNDPRVTRVGAVLRKLRIDEIPQLLNVIKGDMSIVGPRPEWSVCVSEYESALPGYHLRHLVKPGITGWAQVNYPYGQNVDDARKKLAFDLFYVSHSSLVLDCSIILKTLYVLVGRVGGH